MRIPIFIVPKRELTLVFFTEIVSKESSGEFIIGLPPKLHAILPLIGTDVKHSNWVPWVGTNVNYNMPNIKTNTSSANNNSNNNLFDFTNKDTEKKKEEEDDILVEDTKEVEMKKYLQKKWTN